MLCRIDWPKVTIRTSLVLFCILTTGVSTTTFAQDGSQPSNDKQAARSEISDCLTLSKTFIATENNALAIFTTPTAAFSDRKVTCPAAHGKGCTIKVETSSQFWYLPIDGSAWELVSVTGGLTVSPNNIVGIDSTNTGLYGGVDTFQWMIGGVPAGTTQTISVSFGITSGVVAEAGFRTETIELFLN